MTKKFMCSALSELLLALVISFFRWCRTSLAPNNILKALIISYWILIFAFIRIIKKSRTSLSGFPSITKNNYSALSAASAPVPAKRL